MKNLSKQIFECMVVLASFFAHAATAQQKSEPLKVTSVEGVTEYKLDNGLHVLIFPDPSKATITVNVTYLVGSRMEGYGETGMAHLLEHMVFKGSVNHTNIPQELTSHGASPNGSTSDDRTNYFETFSATDENLKWALDLESDRMVNSFIAKKDLETEFSVVRNEFESGENDPTSILMERVVSTAYLWHNYGKSTIGSKEDIEKVPITNLQAFYHKYYQPDNAVLLVAGKVEEGKIISMVNEYFGKIPKPSRVIQEPYTVEPAQDGERTCELKRVGDVQVVSCGYHICNGAHPDYVAFDVITDVLTNQPSGRLYKALVEAKKASSVFGYAQPLKDPGFIYFSADVLKEKSLNDAKQTMMSLFDDLKNNPLTQEEVDRAKNKLLKYFELTYNNSEEVGLTMSEFIAQGDWRLWFLYRDCVQKITPGDVNRVVKEYFKPSNRTVGIFIPDAKPDRVEVPASPDLNALMKDYKGKEALASAEAFDATPANIDSRTKTGTIPGGAKYALLKKTTRGNSVNARILLHIGSAETLSSKETLSEITAGMLMMGTTSKTREQLNDAIDKMKAEIHVYGGGQDVSVNIQTTKENLVAALKLVNDILRKPSFPAGELEKMIPEGLAGIDQQKSDPQAISGNVFARITNPYPENDFRYSMTFDEQTTALKNVKLDDVKKFYADFYSSGSATVAVIGDFDEPAVMTELNTMLQDWTAPVKYERAKNLYFNVVPKAEKINTPDKSNAMLLAGYNLEIRDDDPDLPALVMGNFMLGGGFLNSRLADRIREKEGISYGVGSWLDADPIDKSGGFGSYAIYNPDNADRLLTAYKEELNKMLKDGFKDSELKDARSGYLQERKVAWSKDDEMVGKLNSNLRLGRTMKWSQDFDDKINTLTVEQINVAMNKWIKPEKITYVQAGDFERKKGLK